MNVALRNTGIAVVLIAVFYQWFLKGLLFTTLGISRQIQPLEDFPYSCRRLRHERLEGCEDLWLDDDTRVLYAACSGTSSRMHWNPPMSKLNVTGRRKGGAEIIALDIDSTEDRFGMRGIKTVGYEGATGDGTLDTVGFDVEVLDSSTLRFYLVNQRPPVDENRKYLDASKIGSNATIEIFDLRRGDNKMVHVRTIASPAIYSPNRVAVIGRGAFVLTNDHSGKIGLRKEFDLFLGGGDVVYCSFEGNCHVAAKSIFNFPNGLVKGKDGLIYVPSAADGTIKVLELQPKKNTLKQIYNIRTPMPIDNLAVDANGDIYAAAFPSMMQALATVENPFENTCASTVLRITKKGKEYNVEKVLEDRDRKVLNMVTTARHDVKTKRIFMGGALTPYIMVCEPR